MEEEDETELYVSQCLGCLNSNNCPICKEENNDSNELINKKNRINRLNNILKCVLIASFILIQANIINFLFY